MGRIKSRMPQWDELTQEQQSYLEGLDRVGQSVDDMDSGAATATSNATKINELLAVLREAGLLKG